ncbi:hypothetical protein NKR23_g9748 [Pleurostoma richardsiae]|uniref:Uncharacterized protein n=1 Tax=Pleurostoma richardsiae TaxID=41990 RepID=A0AA38RGL4_9PEZI|nr:hypothetical protein NKR23_g9748 [Pleurostoma richardsiae]
MLSSSSTWASLALLLLGVRGSFGDSHHTHSPYLNESTIYDHTCTSDITVFDTTTILASTTIPITHYVDVTVPYYVNVTISNTKTAIVSTYITESTTTTLHYTVSVTETDSETVTNTQTTTATVPATITTYTTQTIISTTVDPCPTTCSISVGTVNLFFWPTDRPYTYPSTWVDIALAYTFTSPSVYMVIPTARGTNSLGPAGPSTTSWILALDLNEVSTIVDGTVTRQLTLSDLGTDCPQTAEPSAIATMVDSRCDPILAAPRQVSSWAYPCNACGRFGLFDPPYAVPTVTGGLIGTTTSAQTETTTPVPVETTTVPLQTSTPPVGTLLIIYYLDGTAMATATVPTTGFSFSNDYKLAVARNHANSCIIDLINLDTNLNSDIDIDLANDLTIDTVNDLAINLIDNLGGDGVSD